LNGVLLDTSLKPILLKDAFDLSHFGNGQTALGFGDWA
jgi:hypothetical protein